MTTTATTPPDGSGTQATDAGYRPRRHGWLALFVALAVIGIGLLSWIWFHPGDAFNQGGLAVRKSDAHVGTTYYFGTGIQVERAVTVSQVIPLIDGHSALAAVGVVVCGPSTWQIGDGPLSQCAQPRGVRGTRVVADPLKSPYFVLAVTPLTLGLVKVDGFKVVYTDHTTQSSRAGNTIEVDAKA